MIKDIDFPLKKYAQIELYNPLKSYIIDQYGINEWMKVDSIIMDIQKQSQLLDYAKWSTQITTDFKLCEEIETNLIEYIRQIYMLDNIFKSAFQQQNNTLKCNFSWYDSFNPSKKPISINSFKYELICSLYNLAILYHTDASSLACSFIEEDKLKAVAKLQKAYWCILEIKQQVSQILIDPTNLPADLNSSYLTAICNYFVGLAYDILITILLTKSTNPTKLASINKATAQSFQIAYDILHSNLDSNYPDFISKRFKATLLYLAVIHRCQAYDHITQIHLKLVDEELLKGHMGYAVSYLRVSKHDIEMLVNKKEDIERLSPEKRDEINNLLKNISTKYYFFKEKNDKIYHQAEFDVTKLPEIPDETKIIQPLEPKDIKTKVDIQKYFEDFLSHEIIILKQELKNIVSMKLFELDNTLKNALQTKNEAYSQGYINYLLELINTSSTQQQAGQQQKPNIPIQLLEKIQKFQKNGSLQNYEKIKQYIQNSAKSCIGMINDIKSMLAKEKEDDESCRQYFPKEWDRPVSDQLNGEYVHQLKDLEQKYIIAQNMDRQILKKYENSYDWMIKLSQSEDLIMNMITSNSDIEFIKKYQIELNELESLNSQIEEILSIQKIKQFCEEIKSSFLKSDYSQNLISICHQKGQKDKEFDKILDPIIEKINIMINKIKEVYILIDDITNKAKEINFKGLNSQGAVKIIEEINYNINVINQIYDEFQKGSQFYKKLNLYLTNLQKIVSDYCHSRECDKKNRLQELQAQDYYAHFNNPEPFFSEKTGQFPQGTSQFRPPNAQHTFQNVEKNIGTAFIVPPQRNPILADSKSNEQIKGLNQAMSLSSLISNQGPVISHDMASKYNPNMQYGYMSFYETSKGNANSNKEGSIEEIDNIKGSYVSDSAQSRS